MDFTLSETQLAVREVATEVLDREAAGWKALAGAGLLAVPVPEEYGGDGLGLAEVGVLLHEIGRRACDVPVWETLCCGVLPVVRHGTAEQKQALLSDVAAGDLLLAPALVEAGAGLPERPWTLLRRGDGGRLVLSGSKAAVSHAEDAARLLVTATVTGVDDVHRAVVLVDPTSPGVTVIPSRASRGEVEATVQLAEVAVDPSDVLGGWERTAAAAADLRRLAVVGLCLLGDGLVAGARDLTADYVRGRQQFGRSLAEFQAVAQQMADVYIASRTIGLAAASAAWRLGEGLDAEDDLAVAAHWFTVEAPAALHTCHHLHGGMGVDVTYPLHRYFSWTKDVARALGGTQQTLDTLAARPRTLRGDGA